MFVLTGFRSLWPVISFLPWFLLSGAYLLAWVLHPQARDVHSRLRAPRHDVKGLSIMGLSLLLAAAPLALAEPAIESRQSCPASTEEAHSLGDRFFAQGSYRAAGACYLAAGDYARANRAFVQDVGPASAATARQLSDQGQQAKTMLRNFQVAFSSHH